MLYIQLTVHDEQREEQVFLLSHRGKCDASRLSLVTCSFNSIVQHINRNLLLLITSASDLQLRTNKFCSVLFSSSFLSMLVVINKIHQCVVVCAVNGCPRYLL